MRILPFGTEENLEARLAAADICLVSIRPEWSGIVVPSKVYGSLAAGRPLLYSGPPDADTARLIRDLNVGWELGSLGVRGTVQLLEQLAGAPEALREVQRRARAAYVAHFRRDLTIARWDVLLRELVSKRALRRGPDAVAS